jgi:hypothetical protein
MGAAGGLDVDGREAVLLEASVDEVDNHEDCSGT